MFVYNSATAPENQNKQRKEMGVVVKNLNKVRKPTIQPYLCENYVREMRRRSSVCLLAGKLI